MHWSSDGRLEDLCLKDSFCWIDEKNWLEIVSALQTEEIYFLNYELHVPT